MHWVSTQEVIFIISRNINLRENKIKNRATGKYIKNDLATSRKNAQKMSRKEFR